MKLRTILSVTHGLVVVLFICVFLVVFFSLTNPPAPPGSAEQERDLVKLIESSASEETLSAALGNLRINDPTLDLFNPNGEHRRIVGPPGELAYPSFGPAVAGGKVFVEFTSAQRDIVQWMPVTLSDGKTYVLRIFTKRSPFPLYSQVVRNLAVSLAIALGICLLVAWRMARIIARPAKELAQLSDRFGREGLDLRARLDGPKELADLACSFNRMAEYLQSTIEELQEQKEDALRTEALRRQFLADVSHNLRTPLAAVLGWNDTLLEDLSPQEDPRPYLQRMRREILHVSRIVGRLLELSRWEKAGPTLHKETVIIADLLLEVAENLEDSAVEAGVELAFEGLNPRITVFVDRQKVRDIFQILLENVVTHAGLKAQATVLVQPSAGRVHFTVSDNGAGYPPGLLEGHDVARGGDELGRVCLGLSIATRLVTAHGSELKLSNSPTGGAQASFWLSAQDPTAGLSPGVAVAEKAFS